MTQSFIFGGNTNQSYEQIQKQRDIANELLRANMSTPQNVGEGLSAIGRALAAKAIDKRASRADADNRKAYEASRDGTFAALGGYGGGSASPVPYAPAQPATPAQSVADDTMSALGKTPMRPFRDAIASIESAGSGDYAAVGPTNANLGRALGRYQIMEANIGPWSREVLGREVTPDEFLANPQLQDAIFDGKFGQYVQQFGPEGAAQAWFAGPGGVGKMERQDVLGTSVADYTQKFTNALGGSAQPAPTAGGAGNGMANPAVLMKLAEVMGNPYASESDKAIAKLLMDQTVQSMDPMRQMEMQKAQLELQQMQQPEAPKPIEVGGVLLDPQTFQPIFDSRQPQGPAAIVNVDNAQPAGPGADEEALRGALGKKEGESWSTYIDSAVTSSGTMQDMQLLDELINVAPQGPLQGRLAQALPGFSAAADAFQSVVKRVAPTLRAPGSGATSDIEYDGMLKSLPQLSSRPEANRAIAAMMKAKAEINVQRGEIVRSYQNGQLSLSDARKQISEIDQKSIMTPELEGLINGLSEADTGAMDFSKMSAAELADVDIGTLTPEQMDAMLKRFDEVGQ